MSKFVAGGALSGSLSIFDDPLQLEVCSLEMKKDGLTGPSDGYPASLEFEVKTIHSLEVHPVYEDDVSAQCFLIPRFLVPRFALGAWLVSVTLEGGIRKAVVGSRFSDCLLKGNDLWGAE
jgi:hypothetical protein